MKAIARPLSLLIVALLAWTARADVIDMTDGRQFEGEIIAESETQVTIDAMVAGIRAKLTLPKTQVRKITAQPVPSDFFEPKAPVDERVSKGQTFNSDDVLYLEVPIQGRIGQDIFAEAIARILAYAKRYRIEHIVFVIDAREGDIDEAIRINKLLQQYDKDLKYHAIVRQCIGDPLVFAVYVDTVQLLPGGRIGGTTFSIQGRTTELQVADEQVLREQMAQEVGQHLREHGRPGLLAMAMIDPNIGAAAWKDSQGKVQVGPAIPQGTDPSNFIVNCPPGQILVLSETQGRALGMPAFDGDADAFGTKRLDIANWKSESDYGISTMQTLGQALQKRKTQLADQAQLRIANNIQRREQTNRNFLAQIEEARKWDPAKGTYGTMGGGWSWDSDGGRYESGTYLTPDAKDEWVNRSNATLRYLNKALQAAYALKRLDQEAIGLGLEPTYKAGELDMAIESIKTHMKFLNAQRERHLD